jgi:hypothetical protein
LEFGLFAGGVSRYRHPSGSFVDSQHGTSSGDGAAEQRDNLDLLKRLNQHSAARHPENTELQARINSYELAYRMQSSAPEAVDLSKETAASGWDEIRYPSRSRDAGSETQALRRIAALQER